MCSSHQRLFLELAQSTHAHAGQLGHRPPQPHLQGLAQPEEALEEAALSLPVRAWPEEALSGAPPLGPAQLEGVLAGVGGLEGQEGQAQDLPSQRGPQGVGIQAWDPSRLSRACVGGGEAGHIPLQSPDPPKVPLYPC